MSGIGTGVSAWSVILSIQVWVIEGSHASMYSWYTVRSVSLYFLPGRKGVPDRLRSESGRQQRVRSSFWPELLQVLLMPVWQSTQNAPCCLQDSHWFEMQGWRCSGTDGCSCVCEVKHAELHVSNTTLRRVQRRLSFLRCWSGVQTSEHMQLTSTQEW